MANKRGDNGSRNDGQRGQKRSGKRRRKSTGKASKAFWGDPTLLPEESERVRIATEPAAVVNSLGQPPLPGHEVAAGHYFEAVYERAVMMAGALAAASGLIEEDD